MPTKAKEVIIFKEHKLCPDHKVLSDKEKEGLLENYHISIAELPKIIKDDPAIVGFNLKSGDIIKITRKSKSAGTAIFYRVVING
ncbi:MAG: DNA-directed RNA polymerase subunit H [archaeon]|nr:DNA-directed RNA polymerase subunit H [Nanoarchaeota archaeon]